MQGWVDLVGRLHTEMVHCMLVYVSSRTGRAGNHGFAYTFISASQGKYAGEIIKALELSSATVAEELTQLWEDYKKQAEAVCIPTCPCLFVCLSVCTFVCLPRHHKASMLEKLSTLLNCRQPQLLKNLHSYGKTTRNRLMWCVYLYSIKRWTPDLWH